MSHPTAHVELSLGLTAVANRSFSPLPELGVAWIASEFVPPWIASVVYGAVPLSSCPTTVRAEPEAVTPRGSSEFVVDGGVIVLHDEPFQCSTSAWSGKPPFACCPTA